MVFPGLDLPHLENMVHLNKPVTPLNSTYVVKNNGLSLYQPQLLPYSKNIGDTDLPVVVVKILSLAYNESVEQGDYIPLTTRS